jgi:spore coat polysaccharide biosynthesis protein SpsF (cytidylyltransferase family)
MPAYFHAAQKSCDTTLISFMGTLKERLVELVEIPSAESMKKIHQSANSQEQKLAMWDKIKNQSNLFLLNVSYCILKLSRDSYRQFMPFV